MGRQGWEGKQRGACKKQVLYVCYQDFFFVFSAPCVIGRLRRPDVFMP